VLGCLDHVASVIANANDSIMRAAVEFRVADCIRDRIRLAVPQPTEGQRIGNYIDAAMIFTRESTFDMKLSQAAFVGPNSLKG